MNTEVAGTPANNPPGSPPTLPPITPAVAVSGQIPFPSPGFNDNDESMFFLMHIYLLTPFLLLLLAPTKVYELCIDPLPMATSTSDAAGLDIVHSCYKKLSALEADEDRKEDGGKAFRHIKVEPRDPLVRLAMWNLKSKLKQEGYCQEVMSLQLEDGSGEVLECTVVPDKEGRKLTKPEESALVQAALVAPATRWLCTHSRYSWCQTGDVVQTNESPGVADLWLVVGWVWLSPHRSFFHYIWGKKGKLPSCHCVMVRLLSVVSYIAQFEEGIITEKLNLDDFDVASLHFDAIDTTLWMSWWDELFPLFPHTR